MSQDNLLLRLKTLSPSLMIFILSDQLKLLCECDKWTKNLEVYEDTSTPTPSKLVDTKVFKNV